MPECSKDDTMKTGIILAALMALSLGDAAPATAQTRHGHPGTAPQEKTIAVEGAWARASVGGNGAAFVTLANRGDSDDRLVAVKADVSPRAEFHTHLMEGNVMKMRHVDAIPVPAGRTVMLKPGGLHVMFIALEKKLVEGESFPLTLVFEKAGEITVSVAIGKIGAMGPGAMGPGGMEHGHGGSMGGMKH
jgi:copper(I)-binding protein